MSLAIVVAAGLVVIGAAAANVSQSSSRVMVEGSVRSVAEGSFELLVAEGPYCPTGMLCPMFVTRSVLYVVVGSNATIFSPSGTRLPVRDLKPGMQAVASGTVVGKDRIAATGVLLLTQTSGSCGWPDPYGPPCPAPSSRTGP